MKQKLADYYRIRYAKLIKPSNKRLKTQLQIASTRRYDMSCARISSNIMKYMIHTEHAAAYEYEYFDKFKFTDIKLKVA